MTCENKKRDVILRIYYACMTHDINYKNLPLLQLCSLRCSQTVILINFHKIVSFLPQQFMVRNIQTKCFAYQLTVDQGYRTSK